MKTKLIIPLGILLTLLFVGCSEDPSPIGAVETRAVDFDTLEFAPSMKGWELYSWTDGDVWYYSLVPGTNALKTRETVTHQELVMAGEDSLKMLIMCIPEGEEITWLSDEWLENIWQEDYEGFALPPKKIREDLVAFCDKNEYLLHIAY